MSYDICYSLAWWTFACIYAKQLTFAQKSKTQGMWRVRIELGVVIFNVDAFPEPLALR